MNLDSMASLSGASAGSAVGITMLKKAQDMAGSELKLLETLPEPAKSASSPGVGSKLDVSA
jgi:hypothetical protein